MIYLYYIWNFVVFLAYGIDKIKAKKSKWRISEATLVIMAFLLGGIGAMLGMVVFNHKTSKPKFRYLVPLAFILNFVMLYFCNDFFVRIAAFFENLY